MTTDLSSGSELTVAEEPNGHRHLGWALILITVAQLMVVLDATIANIALPYIQGDLDIDQGNLQWIVTGYALAFGGLLLLGGRLGDLFGRRFTFILGVAIFAIASGAGGFAQNEGMLLASRAFQGLGAALASPAALALITTNFPAGPQRNRAFSVYSTMSAAGAAVGLILGGWLTGLDSVFGLDVDGWRLTFLINVPVGIAAAALAPFLLLESERNRASLDLPGALTGTLGLASLVFGFSRAGQQQYGWGDTWTIVALAVGAVLLVAFVLIESRVKDALMPLRILADRDRGTTFLVMMIVPAAMFAMFFFLSQYIQNVLGFSPLKAGVAFLPFSVGVMVGAVGTSRLVAKIDPRFIIGVGTLIAAGALFGFSRLPLDDTLPGLSVDANYWSHVFPFVVMMAIGMGSVFVAATLVAVHGVDHKDSGIGSGVLNAVQQVGGALGLAILSTVAVSQINDKVADLSNDMTALGPNAGLPSDPDAAKGLIEHVAFTFGSQSAFLVGAILILVSSVLAFAFIRVKHTELAGDSAAPAMH